MIRVNINAATIMTQMVLPLMEKKKKGAIVNLASVSGRDFVKKKSLNPLRLSVLRETDTQLSNLQNFNS